MSRPTNAHTETKGLSVSKPETLAAPRISTGSVCVFCRIIPGAHIHCTQKKES